MPGATASDRRGRQADHAGRRLHRLFRSFRPGAARSHPHPQTGSGLFRSAPLQVDRTADQARSSSARSTPSRTRRGRFLPEFAYDVPGSGAVQAGRRARRRCPEGQVLGGQPRVADLGQFVGRGTTAACPQHGRVLASIAAISCAQRTRAEGDDLPGDLFASRRTAPTSATTRSRACSTACCSPAMRRPRRLIANGLRELLAASPQLGGAGRRSGAHSRARWTKSCAYSPSIVAWRRRALMDTSIGGVPVPKGSNILLLLGSANRDETTFTDPSLFNITRKDSRRATSPSDTESIPVSVSNSPRSSSHRAARNWRGGMPGLRLKAGPEIRVRAQHFVPGADRAAYGMERV